MQTASDIGPRRPIGPPTKWNKSIIVKARHYLENYKDYGKNIPSVARLAQVLGISKDRVYVWSNQKDKKELKVILNAIKVTQEAELIENGLSGDYNPGITKVLLTKHGYHDNPQANQGNTGITVQVNRGSVVLKSGGQELEISDDSGGRTLEHAQE